ncbi:unnamed protein product, partial [Rotaria sp. Silwood1]
MGFYIQDLHRQIDGLRSNSNELLPEVLYRGQGMTNDDCEKMKKNID